MIKSRLKRILSSLLTISMIATSMGLGTSSMVLAADDDPADDTRYTVSIDEECENGKIEFNQETDGTFAEGDEVDLKLVADEGYVPTSLTISEATSGDEIVTQNTTDTLYSFTMPKASLTVSATFESTESADPDDVTDVDDFENDFILEDYIRDNANPEYVGNVEDVTWMNVLNVQNTFFDGTQMEKGDTIDSIMSGNDMWNKFITSIQTSVAVYNVNNDSDYFVALVDTMRDVKETTVFDWDVAENNDDGNIIDGCKYDAETGLLYIPKKAYTDGDTYNVNTIQAQIGQKLASGDYEDLEADTDCAVIDNDTADIYKTLDNIFSMETVAHVNTGLDEGTMKVYVNGLEIDSDEYEYNAATGKLTIPASSASVSTVSVVADPDDYDEAKDKSSAVEDALTVYAATDHPSSWNDMYVANPDDPIEMPSWVGVGTALVSEPTTKGGEDGGITVMHYTSTAIASIGGTSAWTSGATKGYVYDYGHGVNGGWNDSWNSQAMVDLRRQINAVWTWDTSDSIISNFNYQNLYTEESGLYFKFRFDKSASQPFYYATTFQGDALHNQTETTPDTDDGVDLAPLGDVLGQCAHLEGDAGQAKITVNHVPVMARILYETERQGEHFVVMSLLSASINASDSKTSDGDYYDSGDGQAGWTILYCNVTPKSGYATLTKSSSNTSITDGNNCYDLAGAEYTVYADDSCTEVAQDCDGNTAKFTTDANGKTETIEMPMGTYYVKETKAPKGYYPDTEVYPIEITADNTEDNPATVSVKDNPMNDPAGIVIEKLDSATGSLAQGAASLEGAEFTVKFYAGDYSESEIKDMDPTRTWVIKTIKDEDGEYSAWLDDEHKVSGDDWYTSSSGKVVLPLGTYTVQETKAPTGYNLRGTMTDANGNAINAGDVYYSQLMDGGDDAVWLTGSNEYEETDDVMRGNLSFEKQDGDTQERMANVEFKVTSETTGESHYIWTDPNGQYDSTAVAHSQNTDAGESYQDGTWFYGTADESEGAPVDDSLGAFPYDTYLIEEMPCDANEGKELVTVEMTVYSDGYMVHLGTIDNYAKQVDLETTLVNGWEGEHDEHEATVFENANITLIDTVHYTGLTEGKTYTMKGVLMDKSTGEVVLDDDGNEVRAEKTFTAEAEEGDVEIEFSFPASTLSYTDVVAFEYLYAEGEDEPIGSHEDLNDVNQSVHLRRPTVWTEATEVGTGNKYVEATDDVNIVDMLDITDLLVGHTYYLYGKAVDKETGEIIIDENGDPIELTVEFVAESEEVLLDVMNFHIDALGMEGKSIVFEEYVFADADRTILICEEEDLGSAEQTITFLSPIDLETTLIDAETESHSSVQDDHVVLVDTVEYEGAIVGETYTMTGTLMDKATGEAVHNLDGSDVTATTEFVAEEESGEVKMTFEFDATGLEDGDATVAFEQMFNSEGTLVGSHEDIDDEDQTVHFPEIHTNATDSETGTNVTEADDEAIIVDTVTYEGLTPGQEYTVEGTLMNKANGEAVVNADGEPVTGSTTFTPEEADGTVEVTFTLDASDLGGSTLVVFEDLLVNEVVVATHADLSDEDQTIYVPDIQTTATDAYDGDHEVEADGTVTIIDTVDYENLIPGQEYTMHGELMDENTGDSLGISNEVTFTPEEADGSVEIEFTFDASDMAGYTTVVFEKLYMTTEDGDQVEVAKHEDLTDEGQTVYLAAPPTTSTPESTPTETYSSPSETPETVQTGDNDMMYLLALMAAVCVACGFGLCYRRREDN